MFVGVRWMTFQHWSRHWLVPRGRQAISGNNVNTLRPRQNYRHFPDNIFICIFLNENVKTFIKISLKFVPKGPINNIPALVQIMAWRRSGDKSLSEPMLVSLPTHICVTRPQWVNTVYWLPHVSRYHSVRCGKICWIFPISRLRDFTRYCGKTS